MSNAPTMPVSVTFRKAWATASFNGMRRHLIRIPDHHDTRMRAKGKPEDVGEPEIGGDDRPALRLGVREDRIV
jgi:hypothetical protein